MIPTIRTPRDVLGLPLRHPNPRRRVRVVEDDAGAAPGEVLVVTRRDLHPYYRMVPYWDVTLDHTTLPSLQIHRAPAILFQDQLTGQHRWLKERRS